MNQVGQILGVVKFQQTEQQHLFTLRMLGYVTIFGYASSNWRLVTDVNDVCKA